MKRLRFILLCLMVTVVLIACQAHDSTHQSSLQAEPSQVESIVALDDRTTAIASLMADLPSAQPDTSAFPVTIENCDRPLTFTEPPQRVISLWQPPNEMLLALGVESQLIGWAGNYAPLPPALEDAAKAVPALGSATRWPSREVMLTQNPDLVVSEGLDGFAFDPAQGYATVAELEQVGIKVISTGSSCDPFQAAARGIDVVYEDLRMLAQVFGVSERGEALIEGLQQRQSDIVERVKGLTSVPTVFYNGGEGPLSVLTTGVWGDAVRQAGGDHVFDESVFQVGREDFANSNAEAILIGIYPGQDADALKAFLAETFPNLPAVQSDRLYPIPTIETEAGIRVMTGLERIARALHPDAFAS